LINRQLHIISGGRTLGFIFGAFWRFVLIGIITQPGAALLRRAYGDDLDSVQNIGIGFVTFAVTWFAAFYWVYAAPFGNYRIVYDARKFPVPTPRTVPEPPAQSNLTAGVSSLREAITGTLGVLFAISYYGIGLLQIAAVVNFFRDVLSWWLIPSLLLAGIVGYAPIVGSLAGSYAAISIGLGLVYRCRSILFPSYYLDCYNVGCRCQRRNSSPVWGIKREGSSIS
jgi:hypothetical protein